MLGRGFVHFVALDFLGAAFIVFVANQAPSDDIGTYKPTILHADRTQNSSTPPKLSNLHNHHLYLQIPTISTQPTQQTLLVLILGPPPKVLKTHYRPWCSLRNHRYFLLKAEYSYAPRVFRCHRSHIITSWVCVVLCSDFDITDFKSS